MLERRIFRSPRVIAIVDIARVRVGRLDIKGVVECSAWCREARTRNTCNIREPCHGEHHRYSQRHGKLQRL